MPTPHSRCLRVAAIVAAVALTGCAAIGARRPRSGWEASEAPDCHRGKGSVRVDGAAAVALGLVGLGLVASDAPELGGLSLAGAVAYAVSAGYGNRSADKCLAAYAAHEGFLAEQTGPGPGVATITPAITPQPATTPRPATTPTTPTKPAPPAEEDEEEVEDDPDPAEPSRSEDEWSAFWVEVFP